MSKTTALLLGTAFTLMLAAPSALAAPTSEDDPARADAKAHFLRGVDHTDRAEWDAAVVEFLASRASLPTSNNTYNAAVALRKAKRFDEALDMYETLLRDFPDIPKAEKDLAERELEQLRASVGTIEITRGVPNAKIVVDGRERGIYPLTAPLRVGTGSHTVRVFADGYLPFESRVDVVGGQRAQLALTLAALTAAGRLSVSEQTGKSLEVVVDNAAVGRTPWEGALAPGEHTVVLRGDGNLGTQPVRPSLSRDQLVTLNLLAEQLDASVRVDPVPANSTVSIDGILLGRGGWQGRLRAGNHQVSATSEGFLPFARNVALKKDTVELVPATLERDPNFYAGVRPSLAVELDSAMPIGVVSGSEVSDACTGGCSNGLPIGFHAVLNGIYQLGSGFGAGLGVGYLVAYQSVSGSEGTLQPKGRVANAGSTDDTLRLSGLTLGAAGQFHRGSEWPITLRLAAGVMLGSVNDSRSGTFTNTTNERYSVNASESAAASYFYVAPEIRIGRYLTKSFEVNLGAEVLLMAALAQPRWRDQTGVVTSNTGRGDGLATFGERTTAGSFLVMIAPGIGARYTF